MESKYSRRDKSFPFSESDHDRAANMAIAIHNRCSGCAANFSGLKPDTRVMKWKDGADSQSSESGHTSGMTMTESRFRENEDTGELHSQNQTEPQFMQSAEHTNVDDRSYRRNCSTKKQVSTQVETRKERIASFRPLQKIHSGHQGNSASEVQASNAPWQPCSGRGIMMQKRNRLAFVGGGGLRNLSTATYENIFYRKKALLKKGKGTIESTPPTHKSSNTNAASGSNAGSGGTHFHAEQRAVFTKIITDYEYAGEETVNKSSDATPKENSGFPSTENVSQSSCNDKKATFADKSNSSESPVMDKRSKDSRSKIPSRKRTARRRNPSKLKENSATSQAFPTFRDFSTQVEITKVISEDDTKDIKNETPKSNSCEKCNGYKRLLLQNRTTLRYLTEMLVSRNDDAEKNANTNPGMMNHYGITQNALPSFDLDAFVRNYLRNLQNTQEFQDIPFSPLQLCRMAVSARDCMAQVIGEKLKHAERILKQKYNALVSTRSLSVEPLDESLYMSVLDSYRRFVRYIYRYLKKSITHIENFEKTCLADDEELNCRMVYSQEQILTINGEKYMAVVIPIRKISEEK